MDDKEIDELVEKLQSERRNTSLSPLEFEKRDCLYRGIGDAITGLNSLKEAQKFTTNAMNYAKFYGEEDCCPFCDSSEIKHQPTGDDLESYHFETYECNSCKKRWEVWYSMHSVNELGKCNKCGNELHVQHICDNGACHACNNLD